jgi:Tripartite tricarboxylate transporter TctA family/Amidohydrolase
LGPGAANNSKEGGELIPTVAFGVPGSGAMAILLGGFLIMGIIPGPDMLTKHLAITFSMVWTLVIANIITVLLCLLVLDQLAKVTYVRGGLIIPFVLRLNWREGNPECKQQPEEYFKKLYYDTAGPIRTAFIKLAYDTVGADQILFGSDYRHGRGGRDDQFFPMTLDAMNDLDVPKADKEKIYYLNAKRLFGFTEE